MTLMSHVSRRELLALLGTAGAAAAMSAVGNVNALSNGEGGQSVWTSVYGGESGLPDLNYCIATTIADLEASNDPNPQYVYFVVDPGKEGPFLYDPGDTDTASNMGTIVVSSAGHRFKRIFKEPINVTWFGATGDGVTDNTAAFTNALNAVRANGGTVFVPKGTFLLKKALVLNDRMNLTGQYADSKLVFELAGNTATTTGVLVLGSDLVVERLYIDVKLTSTLHGFRGNNVTVGEYESASYKNLHNIVIRDLWLTRQDTGYLNNALAISGDAHHVLVEHIKVRGKNVIGIMAHWSGDAPANNNSLVSYHPHDIEIRNVDIEDSQEAAICPSSTYNFRVSGFKARNVKTVFRAIPGDLGDSRSYAGNGTTHEDQRGKAMTGIVLENVYAEKVETTAIYFGLMGAIKDSQGNTVWYRARQSSGMIRNVEVSGLDTSHYAFQIDRFSNLTIDHIRAANYKGYSVYMYRVDNVRLSDLILQDVKRGVMIQQSSHVKITDGNIRLEQANVRNDADAYPVRIEGTLKTVALALPLQVGDTTVTVTAGFDSLEYGQLLEIVGAGTVKVSDYYVTTTATSFHIEPSAIAAPAGVQIISSNVAREIDIVRCSIRNGHSGVYYPFHVDGVTVRDCEMDNLFYYGIYGGMGSSVGLSNVSILRNRIRRCGVNVLDPNVASPTYTGQIVAKNTNMLTIRDNVLGDKANETAYSVQVHDTCSNTVVEDNISLGVRNTTEYAFDFFDQNAAALALGTNTYKANRLLGQGKLRKGAGVSHALADSGNRIVRAAMAPIAGIWMAADLVYNTAPAAGGYVGWVCTQAGTMANAAWSASTSLTAGSVVYTTAKRVYRCTAAGATGTAEPTHTGGIASNGTAVLRYEGPLAEFKAFGPIVSP
ncbi:hypothetical protein FE784_04090 [Paenibacillus hemerocallicola]|uniref:Uncharacterized protein n=1 Tax=Paenibacillus hemerocallicola TaxID=1172614 RepID=A0A5C4TGD8_9BACL|nr:glycosyl hydrolase family 28-related protein [Paenibacillus hemerocallicola]TNJ67570.1 hypothetical protein FE784_04090 [Paenibacillus hemerocallicola]